VVVVPVSGWVEGDVVGFVGCSILRWVLLGSVLYGGEFGRRLVDAMADDVMDLD
jgi:hypothetical protein